MYLKLIGLSWNFSEVKYTELMSLIRDLADQIVAAHRNADLCIPIPTFSLNTPPPQIDNEAAVDQLVAIGGINQDSIHAVARSGVGSVAGVRAITQAKNPRDAVKHLKN